MLKSGGIAAKHARVKLKALDGRDDNEDVAICIVGELRGGLNFHVGRIHACMGNRQ